MYVNKPSQLSVVFIVREKRAIRKMLPLKVSEVIKTGLDWTGLKFWCLVRVWVREPEVTRVSLSKALYHNCFVLRMGH